jgi:uncharacterized membrane protein YciS (DUF1049 family)
MERLKNPKSIAALVLAALALIVFFQNRSPVSLRVLWLATVQTTLATALCAAFAGGLVAGWLAFSWRSRRDKAKTAAAS